MGAVDEDVVSKEVLTFCWRLTSVLSSKAYFRWSVYTYDVLSDSISYIVIGIRIAILNHFSSRNHVPLLLNSMLQRGIDILL